MSGREQKYIDDAFAKNQVFPLGPHVLGLEEDLRKFTGVQACTCLSSGTAAIHLALIILNVNQGDEVICSSFTFAATVNPVLYQKATPVLVESEPLTWNMDPDLLEECIVDRLKKTGKKPKAIIMVHLYGMPAQMDSIKEISDKYNIPVIEDAAEALGSEYDGRKCGSMGDIGILSFNGNKIITTSGGGALLSHRKEHAKAALFLATQARDPAPHYQHSQVGYNYRMSNISAGIGRGQMEVLHERIKKRRDNYAYYKECLEGLPGLSFQSEPDPTYFSNRWLSVIVIDPEVSGGADREKIRLHLESYNIESRPLWKPMHLQPLYQQMPVYGRSVSDKLFEQGLCLPSSSNLTPNELSRVSEAIQSLWPD